MGIVTFTALKQTQALSPTYEYLMVIGGIRALSHSERARVEKEHHTSLAVAGIIR
jgi:hypothetical protein